jgi:tetratricopeptide (TPR) repeat protein
MEPGPPWIRPVLWAGIAALACPVLVGDAAGQPGRQPESSIPPWKRPLSGDTAAQVVKLESQIAQLRREGRFAEAIGPARAVAETRTRLQGGDHWQAADARRTVDDLRAIAALPEEGRKAMASVGHLEHQASAEHQLAHYAEAERISRTLLEIRQRWLGEDHPDSAQSGSNVAYCLNAQGRYTEAEPLYRQALAIYVKALGENHPGTAGGYNLVALNLAAQGKHAAAEPLFRKALAIYLDTLGEGHPDSARSYHNVAFNLNAQGKYAEAEPLFRRALAINLEVLGEDNPRIAIIYNGLALNLNAQGKYTEAEPLFHKALAIRLKALGENHPGTAVGYNSVAFNLAAQGKHAAAEPLLRQALAIRLKAMGEGRPDTAGSYNHLAYNLNAQGKHAEADLLYRKALAIRLKALGENHPDTAGSYNNLAYNLNAQRKYTEAEPLFRQALAIWLKVLGENHPDTAGSYNNLAYNLDAQGKLDEAVANWTAAAAILERIRGTRSASGLERSLTPLHSPQPALAIALARRGQPRDAWARWESDFARGLLDELSARQLRPLNTEQRRREADLAGQLQRLDERIARLASKPRRTQDEDQQLDALRTQQSSVRGQWVEFQTALDRQYPAATGKPSALEEVQKALPPDTTLVGWLDVRRRHWACLVRRDGAPVWVPTPGSGPEGLCTPEDHRRDRDCQIALATRAAGWRDLTAAVARQRLGPLLPHLDGVRHLIVLPSRGLAAVPVEALVVALPADSPRPVVSYAPSGSMLARLSAPHSQPSRSPRLLALGDPAFPRAAPNGPAPAPPNHGIPILAVAPHGVADLFEIRPGDVLLEYNGKVLRTVKDLAIVPAGDKPLRVPIKLWREGEIRSREIAAGPLGIQSDPNRPAAQVVLGRRAAAEVLRSGVRAAGWAPLPGTRREVQAIAALFPSGQATTLLGQEATESKLQQLAQSGALKSYRYLHLATHGQANPNVALSSALFLAAEPDRPAASADPAALESAPDGQITAEQIVRTWELDAELVVLSACESGLGRYAGGEGYLGFAQALFVKGARSLVLSQWKVDDKATALLMSRFYQNLLGKRPGLNQPLPKAAALDEAKHWLRNLSADEAGTALAALERGTVRPLVDEVEGPAPRAATSASQPAGVRPYAHPYYWAAFLLIGDPN